MSEMPSDAIYVGRNADTRPDKRYRCRRCGFICNPAINQSEPPGSKVGWGTYFVTQTSTKGDKIMDPVVGSGCPQCGCMTYNL